MKNGRTPEVVPPSSAGFWKINGPALSHDVTCPATSCRATCTGQTLRSPASMRAMSAAAQPTRARKRTRLMRTDGKLVWKTDGRPVAVKFRRTRWYLRVYARAFPHRSEEHTSELQS